MILTGLATYFTATPHPELATAGTTLMLATGLIKTNGNGNGAK